MGKLLTLCKSEKWVRNNFCFFDNRLFWQFYLNYVNHKHRNWTKLQSKMHVPCENVFVACHICQSCKFRGANGCEVMTAAVQQLTCSGDEKWFLMGNWFMASSTAQNRTTLVWFFSPT